MIRTQNFQSTKETSTYKESACVTAKYHLDFFICLWWFRHIYPIELISSYINMFLKLMSKDRIPILGPNLTAFEPLIFALAHAALSLAFRRTFSTTRIAKEWYNVVYIYIYWTATNRCAAIGIKKKCFFTDQGDPKITGFSLTFTVFSRVFHALFTLVVLRPFFGELKTHFCNFRIGYQYIFDNSVEN